MTDPRCSLVVRAYNEEKHIGRLLAGVFEQSIADETEVILVDSGSTDATVAIASRFPVKVVSIEPQAFTFGRSLNKGISQAQAEFIVIASAHVYPVYSDWLERLLAPFEDPEIALVYGKQRGNAQTRFSEAQVFAAWFPETSLERQEHPFCNNANAAIRRALWEGHPYNETLPGLEDLEWASWALDQGHAIGYAADAPVIHVHEESASGVYNRYRREAMALKRIRPEEHFGLWDFLRLSVANIVSDLIHASREGVLLREFGGILWFRLLQFWGTYRGFRLAGPLTSRLRQTFYYPRDRRGDPTTIRNQTAPIDYHRILGGGEGPDQ